MRTRPPPVAPDALIRAEVRRMSVPDRSMRPPGAASPGAAILPETDSWRLAATVTRPPLRPLAAIRPLTDTFAPATAIQPPLPPLPPLAARRPPIFTMPPAPPSITILPARTPTLLARMDPGLLTALFNAFAAVAALKTTVPPFALIRPEFVPRAPRLPLRPPLW